MIHIQTGHGVDVCYSDVNDEKWELFFHRSKESRQIDPQSLADVLNSELERRKVRPSPAKCDAAESQMKNDARKMIKESNRAAINALSDRFDKGDETE